MTRKHTMTKRKKRRERKEKRMAKIRIEAKFETRPESSLNGAQLSQERRTR